MSSHARIWRMSAHISHPREGNGLLPAPTGLDCELCSPPSTSSPKSRCFAWQVVENNAGVQKVRFTHSLLLQSGRWPATEYGSAIVWFERHPERHAVLQAGVSVSAISPVFSLLSLGHSLRCLSRAPSPHPAKSACRGPRFCGLRASAFSELLPQPGALGPLPENAALALGAGHLASLRAGVSRGQSGQIQTGEKQWHSTKTKSL